MSFLLAHDLIFIFYKIAVERGPSRITCRDFSRFCRENLLSEVEAIDWSDIFTIENINKKVRIFNDLLGGCINML